MRIANKLLPSLSKTRFNSNKIGNSPSNNISLFDPALKEESPKKGKQTMNEGHAAWKDL
jgi:hypothetical protein